MENTMDDDIQIHDDHCPQCGHYTYWRECPAFDCEDGYYDGYEDDPLWYDPGELVRCEECHGRGYFHWCPNCGYDLTEKQYLNGEGEGVEHG